MNDLPRYKVRPFVRQRDGNKCTECGMTSRQHKAKYKRDLDVHRIVPGSVYTADGCVTLCKQCHRTKPKTPSDRIPQYKTFCVIRVELDQFNQIKNESRNNGRTISAELARIIRQHFEPKS